MASQQLAFEFVADSSNFVANTDKVNKQFQYMNTGAAKAQKSLGGLTGAFKNLASGNRRAVMGLGNAQEAFQKMQLGGRQTTFVVNDLMDAMMIGGTAGLALSAAAAAAGFLWRQLNKTKKEAKDTAKMLKERLGRVLKGLQQDHRDLAMEIRLLSKTRREIDREDDEITRQRAINNKNVLAAEIADQKAWIRDFGPAAKARIKSKIDLNGELVKEFERRKKVLVWRERQHKSAVQRIGVLDQNIAKMDRLIKVEKDKEENDKRKEARDKRAAELESAKADAAQKLSAMISEQAGEYRRLKNEVDAYQSVMSKEQLESHQMNMEAIMESLIENASDEKVAQEQKTQAQKVLLDIQLEQEKDQLNKKLDAQKAAEKERVNIKRKSDQEIERLRKEDKAREQAHQDLLLGYGQAGFSMSVNLAQQAAQMKFDGEKDFEERMQVLILKRLGNELVGHGTSAVWKGILMNLAVPGSGVPLIAGGSAAIAAGVGFGAAGSQAQAGLNAKVESRRESEREADKKKREDKRSSGRSGARGARLSDGGSSSGGAGVTINLSYGVGGPDPESAAIAVVQALDLARRRGIS